MYNQPFAGRQRPRGRRPLLAVAVLAAFGTVSAGMTAGVPDASARPAMFTRHPATRVHAPR
jgi:hypothetical protein